MEGTCKTAPRLGSVSARVDGCGMLFNSYTFIFLFFPAALTIYVLVARYGRTAKLGAILAASLFFYGWWDVRFLLLLGLSILGNYTVGQRLTRSGESGNAAASRAWLALGVTLNLVVLGIFKYANFFAENVDWLVGTHYSFGHIILPLGISFFTFEQIGYLADIKRGHHYRADLLSYAVFVSFFPRLVAGPILRYSEIEPQFAPLGKSKFSMDDLAVGLTIFFIGLCKKSFLADGIAPYVAPAFSGAASGHAVGFLVAWGGVLAYTCQLYFDFSGYSDMAIGAARCFGIKFPVNFASPYKSGDIIEFWRRWHMTLSRFLRDYLYIPLGGNRRGPVRRYANLFVTMLLGGLWHGANWTFVCWGGLHGSYLMINHGWKALAERNSGLGRLRASHLWRVFAPVLTFLAVVVGWVFFRSPDFVTGTNLLAGMCGLHGTTIPNGLLFLLRPLRGDLAYLGITFGMGSASTLIATYVWVVALLAVAFVMPNTQELLARYSPSLVASGLDRTKHALYARWSLSPGWAIVSGVVVFIGVISITRVSEFLYWQF